MERLIPLLALALVSGCAEPTYTDPDGDAGSAKEDASAMIARDGGGNTRVDASMPADAGTEFIPQSDAGPPTETSPDGSVVQLASTMPDWAKPLLGSYVGRSHWFSQDNFGALIRVRDYLRVEVVETADADPHVELRLHLCDSFGEGTTADSLVTEPERTSERVHRVLFGDHSWATQTQVAADGFTRPMPERCVGKEGTLVGKDPKQTWIAGNSCACPSSVEVAPNKLEDCRVFDQDMDGAPGSSLRVTPKVFGLGPSTLYVTTINQTTFLNGTVNADGRHTAQLAIDQRGWQLGCEPACTDISQTPAPCPPSRSKLELVRAGEGISSCSQLIANATTLFPSVLPEYPASCP